MSYLKKDKRLGRFFKAAALAGMLAILLTACAGNTTEKVFEKTIDEQSLKPVSVDELPKAILDGQVDRVYAQLSDDIKANIELSQFELLVTKSMSQVKELKLQVKTSLNGGELCGWSDETGEKGMRAIFHNGKIVSIKFVSLKSYPETDQKKAKTVFAPPFRNDWYVFWGGLNPLINYHYTVDEERYAYDIFQVKDGYTYKGDPKKNESYYAFGQDILAAADGTIVTVVNDIADNEPGIENNEKSEILGNRVIIDHGNNEFSYYAHLQKGSVNVKVGDKVKTGDLLGKCGNSGGSSEAHLHFQVSEGPDFFSDKPLNFNWEGGVNPIQGDTLHGSNK